MLLFSKRRKLGLIFEKWCIENDASVCPENFVAFLVSNDLINEEKAKEFINEYEEKEVKNENT